MSNRVLGCDDQGNGAMRTNFNGDAFCASLNAHRLAKLMTWKQVAEESGVSASTLTRMTQGKRPDVDGLAALLKWSGLKAEQFYEADDNRKPEALAQMTALLRADPKLSEAGKLALEGVLRATYEQFRSL